MLGFKLAILVSTSHKTADHRGLWLIFGGGKGVGEGDGKEKEQEWRCITPTHKKEGPSYRPSDLSDRMAGLSPAAFQRSCCAVLKTLPLHSAFPHSQLHSSRLRGGKSLHKAHTHQPFLSWKHVSPIPVLSLVSSLLSIFQLQLPNAHYDV